MAPKAGPPSASGMRSVQLSSTDRCRANRAKGALSIYQCRAIASAASEIYHPVMDRQKPPLEDDERAIADLRRKLDRELACLQEPGAGERIRTFASRPLKLQRPIHPGA